MGQSGPEAVEARGTLAETRAFLASGAPWPEELPPDCIETHASLVFLTRDRAWKLKKPVLLPHVDLRTLAARERSCRAELRLNRELAGEVYRGLVRLVRQPDGSLSLGGTGRTVDWLVESVRLPATAMLDRRLRAGPAPTAREIGALCDRLIAFYRSREVLPGAGAIYFRRLLAESLTNARNLRAMRRDLGPALSGEVLDHGTAAVVACRAEILARGDAGIVIEGHGDLRAEHVCLTDPPVVFDRVEFDHGFRLVDPYDEFNGLGLECAEAGADWIRDALLDRLGQAALPPPSHALLAAYGVNRWLTRARLAIDHLRDADVRTPAKWPARARLCLAAAARLAAEAERA